MTEYSVGVPINGREMDIPTLVPGLTKQEIEILRNLPEGKLPPDSIINKAVTHAEKRVSQGKSPFWNPADDRGR